ncbi:hypothetical protein B0H34DRAFT_298968 [Crassisporium funariophilum]|nr:hypothetical protein B0H34DRAFT_298968 [Crassisporium funariophilum]
MSVIYLVFQIDALKFLAWNTAQFVVVAMARASVPRIPPRNWTLDNRRFIGAESGTAHGAPILKPHIKVPNLTSTREDQIESSSEVGTKKNNLGNIRGIPAVPKVQGLQGLRISRVASTPAKPAVPTVFSDLSFSIYTPSAQFALLITPVRRALMSVQDVNVALLKGASERVSEILRENRRRLDAGEDPSTLRKEARRRRAQELSARRKNHANPFL